MVSPEVVDDCVLLDPFGRWLQILVGLLAFSVLVVKRFKEEPRRTWLIWSMDVTKQAASGGLAHGMGMLTAELLSSATAAVSPCSWYLIAFTTDVIIGVPASLVFFRCAILLSAYFVPDHTHPHSSFRPRYDDNNGPPSSASTLAPAPSQSSTKLKVNQCVADLCMMLASSGDYEQVGEKKGRRKKNSGKGEAMEQGMSGGVGAHSNAGDDDLHDPATAQPSVKVWLVQLVHWSVLCVVPARFLCMGIVYSLRHQLVGLARFISSWALFVGHPRTELVTVMLIGPLLLNSIQYLVQDAFLKAKKAEGEESAGEEEERSIYERYHCSSPLLGERAGERRRQDESVEKDTDTTQELEDDSLIALSLLQHAVQAPT